MLYVLLALLLVLGSLFSPVYFYAVYNKTPKSSGWRFYSKMWGIKIPLAKRISKEGPKGEETEKEVRKSFREIRGLLKETGKTFAPILKELRDKISSAKTRFDMEIGAGNAPATAVLTGISWGLYYGLLGALSAMAPLQSHKESIRANYKEKRLLIDFEGVVSIKLVHIIFVFAKTVKAAITLRKNRRKASG